MFRILNEYQEYWKKLLELMNLIQKFNPFVTVELAANALPLQGTVQIREAAKPFWRKNKY